MDWKIKIGDINLSVLKTDDDIQIEAKKHIDHVLLEMGEAAAADMWKELKKSGLLKSSSLLDKHKFIREGGRKFQKNASLHERKNVEDIIFDTIKGMKEEREGNTGNKM
jgi:hypothetical protein